MTEEGNYLDAGEGGGFFNVARKDDDQTAKLAEFMSRLEQMEYDVESGRLLEYGVPEYLREMFYGFLLRDTVFTNLNERDYLGLLYRMDHLFSMIIDRIPEEQYNAIRPHLWNMRNVVYMRAKRAVKGFERNKLVTQISQSMQTQTFQEGQVKRPGLFNRLLGKR
jgi:hypothetical protein